MKHPLSEKTVDSIRSLIEIIVGSDLPPGMKDTPRRVTESWLEIFSGYEWQEDDIEAMMTVFDGIPQDGIVLLKDIEFYSTCEHHWMPFSGKAHVAYIPGKSCRPINLVSKVENKYDYRVVGISKLARVVDIYSRRFQTQEMIAIQVVNCLEKYLRPLGSACFIEAKHHCMCSRGVSKQHSVMMTHNLSGTFLEGDGTSRQELLSMVYGGRQSCLS
jgi:GTP cyclohydrolase IA